jgi:hypothetical protein
MHAFSSGYGLESKGYAQNFHGDIKERGSWRRGGLLKRLLTIESLDYGHEDKTICRDDLRDL